MERFLKAQAQSYEGYETALGEIKNGHKRSHWMWYIFPQFRGLGGSYTSEYYAIQSMEEAEDYVDHPVLGKRLITLCEVLLSLPEDDPEAIFGYTDKKKLRSSMTLFELAAPKQRVFAQVLEKYYGGKRDKKTIGLLKGSEV